MRLAAHGAAGPRSVPCLTWFEAVVTGGPGVTKPAAEPTWTRSASSRSTASHDQSDIQDHSGALGRCEQRDGFPVVLVGRALGAGSLDASGRGVHSRDAGGSGE